MSEPEQLQPESSSQAGSSPTQDKTQPKNPPCDQCRRRKVRCNAELPTCDRCTQSGLRCSRDIARKRRGPKKGSGSVIAKLRDGTDPLLHNSPLPDLAPSGGQDYPPDIYRSLSRESSYSNLSSTYGSSFAPTSHPIGLEPRSVPQLDTVGNGNSIPGQAMLPPQAGPASYLESPLAWQPAMSTESSQYPSPESTDFLSVNELAHRIFSDNDISFAYQAGGLEDSMLTQDTTPLQPTSVRPPSIDALLQSPQAMMQSPTHSQSATPFDPHQMLQRSRSAPAQIETQVAMLAAEVGVSASLMSQCVKQYFKDLYPIMPIIHRATYLRRLSEPESMPVAEKCMLAGLCAFTLTNAPPATDLHADAKKDISRRLITYILELRKQSEWIETTCLTDVITSTFVALIYWEIKQYRTHHFYLREATGMALEQELHLDSTYKGMTHMQQVCHRRMFALLFVTERGLAILRNKPIMISSLPHLPNELFDDEDPSILAGFQCLCRLFALLDEKFVEVWRYAAPGVDNSHDSAESIASIQHDLNAMSFETNWLSDIQKVDVLITQQWLRLIFWQASMRQGLVSSTSQDPVFYYDYPISIARTLCEMMSKLPMEAVIVHGSGIFEKVFEVAYTLMDALTIAKVAWSNSEELRYLFSCLSASPNSHNTYVRMLETKMNGEEMNLRSVQPGTKTLQSPELSQVQHSTRKRVYTG